MNRSDFIPYSVPSIGEEEIDNVVSVLKSNWISKGPVTREFEEKICEYLDVGHAVGLNSCTSGLFLSLKVLGIGNGDEVITTPFTFVSTANTILQAGATPVFVDIDPKTMNINVNSIVEKITKKTKAIIPVHFAGYPCEMEEIRKIAERYNLKVIEDAAHALSTEYQGTKIGSLSDFTCFSFYPTKNITTGEGGIVTTNNEKYAERLRILSLHGMSKNAWNRYSNTGNWFYEVNELGYKYNMNDISAALGLAQLDKLSNMQKVRKKIAEYYNEGLKTFEGVILPYDNPMHTHSWHLYCIRINENILRINRDELITLLTERGIGTSVHFIPVPMHSIYKRLGYKISEYPKTLHSFETILSLPLYPSLKGNDMEYIVSNLQDIFMKNMR